MTTAVDIIGSALRKISAVDPNEPLDAGDIESCLSALNRLAMRWESKTITLGWSPITDPYATIPVPIESEDALVYNLAIMIAPEYGAAVSRAVLAMASESLNDLKNYLSTVRDLKVVTDMPSSGGRRWNMYTDSVTG
jgi:hypothetical protein